MENDHISESECSAKIRAMEDALYVIGGKWKLRVILALSNGSRRFNEIQRKVAGITPRVLSAELKDMEANGFLKRKVNIEATPVIVEYELTAYSYSLKEVVESLINWGTMHRIKLKQENGS
ncbi:transcriptional regulator, HxlR family [Pedobacter westerhofensis]|uniref:Transcriptional regulator, HxlR family n=1 Tax=Pedobacter westerhofensis TaxID=425512 RepID=A0A521FFC1_9SPHI|nr:helix-turn-helix domain-containing protein [Pedobacter westerhofensis]SMO94351.1 transcriptional regulator, HxlR family [Pedobacter westerhofensis]